MSQFFHWGGVHPDNPQVLVLLQQAADIVRARWGDRVSDRLRGYALGCQIQNKDAV